MQKIKLCRNRFLQAKDELVNAVCEELQTNRKDIQYDLKTALKDADYLNTFKRQVDMALEYVDYVVSAHAGRVAKWESRNGK